MMHAIEFRISESNEATKEKPEGNKIFKRCLSQNPNQDNGSTKQTLKILHSYRYYTPLFTSLNAICKWQRKLSDMQRDLCSLCLHRILIGFQQKKKHCLFKTQNLIKVFSPSNCRPLCTCLNVFLHWSLHFLIQLHFYERQ